MDSIYEILTSFYSQVGQLVEVELREEVLGGGWEAVIDGRADIAVVYLTLSLRQQVLL